MPHYTIRRQPRSDRAPQTFDVQATCAYSAVKQVAGVDPIYLGGSFGAWPIRYGTLVPGDMLKWHVWRREE